MCAVVMKIVTKLECAIDLSLVISIISLVLAFVSWLSGAPS